MTITCSTKVCSFGKQVVEKVETENARLENGRFVYRIHRSPMCEYMINFIHKLKHLPEKYMMNSVLENFTILQVKEKKMNRFPALNNSSRNIYIYTRKTTKKNNKSWADMKYERKRSRLKKGNQSRRSSPTLPTYLK